MRVSAISGALIGAGLLVLAFVAYAVWTYVPPQNDAVTFFSPGAGGRVIFPVAGVALVAAGALIYWRSRSRRFRAEAVQA